MNTLNSLYFPGTTIYSISQYPLFLLFPGLHLLSPAESSIHGDVPQAIDSFIESGLCRKHTPSPLGNDLGRFIHLVNDIKNRKDDYRSQLSALTLAAMSESSGNDESSSGKIISSLLGAEHLPAENKKKEKLLKLWQARLLLAIGEMIDYEEEEIALQLVVTNFEENELFRKLQGKDDLPADDYPIRDLAFVRDHISPPGQDNTKKRMQAWKLLYREKPVPAEPLLLTTCRDAADLILESFEKNRKKTAVHPAQLSLPAVIGLNTEDTLSAVNNFHKNSSDIISIFTDTLTQLKDDGNLQKSACFEPEFCRSLEQLLETQFPAEKHGRIPLSIYSFPNISCSSLLGADNHADIQGNSLMVVADTAGNLV
ncbi:MAG: hypothetical protein JRC87_01680 [Deltaproteobacteria bacterium]|nr:hypothetical protein [Deltaproteobacteria bacterium]